MACATCTFRLDTRTRFLLQRTCLPSGTVSQCHTIWKKKEKHYWERTSAGHLKMMTENSTTLSMPCASSCAHSEMCGTGMPLDIQVYCIYVLFLCQTWKVKQVNRKTIHAFPYYVCGSSSDGFLKLSRLGMSPCTLHLLETDASREDIEASRPSLTFLVSQYHIFLKKGTPPFSDCWMTGMRCFSKSATICRQHIE